LQRRNFNGCVTQPFPWAERYISSNDMSDTPSIVDKPVAWAPVLPAIRARASAYLELTKARIGVLVLLTTLVGFCMALPAGEALTTAMPLLFHCLAGTALVVAGANVLNQCLEIQHDRLMVRTANRPLPSGRVGAVEAATFGAVCGAVGVLQLSLWVNLTSAALAALALISYVLIYTPLKRVTSMCVLVGAVPGALPPVIGWTAASGELPIGAWLLFGILFFWQLPHFAAIAWQYRSDYQRAGYPMLAVIDPEGSRTNLHVMTHTTALLLVSLMPVHFGLAGPIYGGSAMLLGLAFLATGVWFLRNKTRVTARTHVIASVIYLPLLLVVMMLDGL
jgi:heme o synthase